MVESRGRWVVLAVLGALALLLGAGMVLTGSTTDDRDAAGAAQRAEAPQGEPRDLAGALGLLHRWDAARAAAWAQGDVVGLRGLYLTDAQAGRSDITMLRQYLARGLVVRDLRMQVLRARLRRLDADVVRLQVTERLAGGVAATADGTRALPHDTTTTRVVELRRSDRRWRVAAVAPR